ncbi:MAG: hypothetical protein GY842_24520 [bacterium]|nr:hypothetical protein [bacterium]
MTYQLAPFPKGEHVIIASYGFGLSTGHRAEVNCRLLVEVDEDGIRTSSLSSRQIEQNLLQTPDVARVSSEMSSADILLIDPELAEQAGDWYRLEHGDALPQSETSSLAHPDGQPSMEEALSQDFLDRAPEVLLLLGDCFGLDLMAPRADLFHDQLVYLDFSGAENVTYDGNAYLGPFDLPPFATTGTHLEGLERQIIVTTLDYLRILFDGTGVVFTTETPEAYVDYSTVFVGGDDRVFRELGAFLGIAEQVDVGNADPADNAFVFSESMVPGHQAPETLAHQLADCIAEVTLYLLGYAHSDDADAGDRSNDPPARERSVYQQEYGDCNWLNVYPAVGSHTFRVNGIGPDDGEKWTEWYIDDVYKETDHSYWGNAYWDPEYTYYFSASRTEIKALIYDGDWNYECAYGWTVWTDTTAPHNPSWFDSNPDTYTWTTDNKVYVQWSGAWDNVSLQGYYYKWTTSPSSTVTTGDYYRGNTDGSDNRTSSSLSDSSSWYFHIKYIDTSGNLASSTAHYGPFKIDRTAPSTPSLDSPSDHATTSDRTPYLDWYSSSDATSGVDYYRVEVYDWGLEPDISDTASSSHYQVSSSLAYKKWYWKIRAVDRAGNESSWSNEWDFTIADTVPPSNPTSFSSNPSTNTRSNDNRVYVNWSGASDNVGLQGYHYKWTTSSSSNVRTSDVYRANTDGSDNRTSDALSDSSHWYFHIRYKDTSGNLASGTAHYGPFKIDRTPPGLPAHQSPPNNGTVNTLRPMLTWSAASDGSGSGVVNYHLKVYEDWGVYWDKVDKNVGNVTTYTLTSSESLQWDKQYGWRLYAIDAAGNTGSYTGNWLFTVVGVPGSPGTPDLAAEDDTAGRSTSDNITYQTTGLTFSWSAASGTVDRYYYAWDDSTPTSSWTSSLGTSVNAPSGNGNHTFYVRGWNSIAGYGSASSLTVFIDRNHPSITNLDLRASDDTGKYNNDNLTNDTNVRFTWTGNANGGSGIYKYWYGWDTDANDGSTSNTYKDISPPSNNGTYTFYVGAEAESGLWAYYPNYTDQETVTWDTIAPVPPTFLSPAEGALIADTTPALDWSQSGVWKWQAYVREDQFPWLDARTSPETSSSQWTASPTLSYKPWGWQVRAWDIAGNLGSYGRDGVAGDWGHFVVEVRDIYVEIDWMEGTEHSHMPSQCVVDAIVATFAAEGYTIHLDVSNAVPHVAVLALTGPPGSSPAFTAIRNTHFNHAGDARYYYSLWGHNYSYNGQFTTSSGIADLPGGNTFISLGSFARQVGTPSNQIGTFIHELGHNLGQRHGGEDHSNYKPNYISIMNYYYQMDGIGDSLVAWGFAPVGLDFNDYAYSHGTQLSLDEDDLDESTGVGLGQAVDWSCDGDALDTHVVRLLHDDASLPTGDWCAGRTGSRTVIEDFDNWADVQNHINEPSRAAEEEDPELRSSSDYGECITWADYITIEELGGAREARAGVCAGDLIVSLLPADVVGLGARWRMPASVWRNNGEAELDLPVGDVTIEFRPVSGWTTPEDEIVTIVEGQTTYASGTYAPNSVLISGYVRDGSGYGVNGVALTANNGGGSATTDGDGYYEVEVPYDWSGRVTPSKADWTISPPYRDYSNVTSDQGNEDYTGYYPVAIWGYVENVSGTGLSGVVVSANNGGGSATTGGDGYYEVEVAYGWSGRVTPSKADWTISPPYRDYSNVTSDQGNEDYTGIPQLDIIEIEGPTSVNENSSQDYSCRAYYTDGTSQYVPAQWDEDSPYATIAGTGLLTTYDVDGNQPCRITATYTDGGITRNDTLDITIVDATCYLTMQVSPFGTGTTTPSVGTHTYDCGEVVNICANPEECYDFDYWDGPAAEPSSSCSTVDVDGDIVVTAVFVPSGPGADCGDPGSTDCDGPDTCDGAGNCQPNLVGDGTPCDDGDICNIGETCQGGICTGGSAVNCDSFDTFCADYECDAGGVEGNCDTITPINEGQTCNDEDPCTEGDECVSGACVGTPDTERPAVFWSTLDDDVQHYQGCPVNSIELAFSENVRGPGGIPLSVDDFEVDGSSAAITNFSYDDVSYVVTFTFPDLADVAWHTIRVSGVIEDICGNQLFGNTSWGVPGADDYWIDVGVLCADFQQDGDVDVFDRTQFLAAWTNQNGGVGDDLSADHQCDGDVDVFDRTQFLACWTDNNGMSIGSSPDHSGAPSIDECGLLIQGVECVLFQADSIGVYILDNYGGYGVGDYVRVSGALDPHCLHWCMQGDGCIISNTIGPCF